VLLGSCGGTIPGRGASGPLVLVSIDTLRADHLPAYGFRDIATPAIDRLAHEGTVFERALAHSPQTLPAHASILTGLLPFEHGVRDNVGFTLRPLDRTLPALLHTAGYRTAGFVSAFVLRPESGIAQGFETFDGEMPPAAPDSSMGNVQRGGRDTLARAVRWLDTQPDGRFFLFVHFYEPHKPYAPPPEYASAPSPYDGEIMFADSLVGQLVGALEQRRLWDTTTMVLLSDHGEGLGDHGEQEHGIFLYDETVRVPLIVRPPRASHPPSARIAAPVQQIDVMPTLLDFGGVAAPSDLRGVSLRAAVEGRAAAPADRGIYSETLYARFHFGWSELYALTDARFRYIRAPRPELYDLAQDPRERSNAVLDRATTATAMRGALDRLIANRVVEAPGRVSPEDRERFQALGYIGATSETPVRDAGRVDPKDGIALLEDYRAAVNLRSARRFAEAAAALERIVARDEGMLDVWLQLAQTRIRLGDHVKAIDALEHALRLKPEQPDALIGIANAKIRLGDLDGARRHAELALGADPARAHEILARIALARGRDEEALRHAAQAQQADPSLALPSFVRGLLLHRRQQWADALQYFVKAAEQLRPRRLTLPELHFYTGDTLAQLDRYDEAEREFREEIRLFPENARAYVSLSLLERARGHADAAVSALRELVEQTPSPANYTLAVRALTIMGQTAAAQDLLARGRRAFPESRELRAGAR
jgi:choline-sulfatase